MLWQGGYRGRIRNREKKNEMERKHMFLYVCRFYFIYSIFDRVYILVGAGCDEQQQICMLTAFSLFKI